MSALLKLSRDVRGRGRAVAERPAREPPRDGASERQSDGDERVDEVSFRPQTRPN